MNISDWVNLRTFHHRQFSDITSLLELKKSHHTSVSLCLPTLNEVNTLGRIIKILRRELQLRFPLIDEILVVDSGSTDGTVELARKMGVPVYFADQILPQVGSVRGKGENLWKSLYAARGDIIVWVDTDIENMHPRFVYGLLGPMLFQKEIGFVKGFYRRPLRVGKKLAPVGGGRVTEILVKPFFNMLFPQLALFQQPLSGEYAGRREILERIPFFTGYGVETAMLIDIEARFGLARMAQVDLEVRIHRNQDLEALKKMAYGILRILLMRAEQQGKVILMESIKNQLVSLIHSTQRRYEIVLQEIQEIERPPIILQEAYQKLRKLEEDDLILVQEVQKRRKMPLASLSPYLDPGLMILEGMSHRKDRVLEELSRLCFERGVVPSAAQLLHEFMKRETSLSTGVGEGIAIPHAMYPGVRKLQVLLYRNVGGVHFDALDGAPVRLVLAVVAPPDRRSQYLDVLSSISSVVKDVRIRELLLRAETAEEVITILRKAEIMKRFERELRLIEP